MNEGGGSYCIVLTRSSFTSITYMGWTQNTAYATLLPPFGRKYMFEPLHLHHKALAKKQYRYVYWHQELLLIHSYTSAAYRFRNWLSQPPAFCITQRWFLIPYIIADTTPPNIVFFCFNSRIKNRFHTIVVQAIRFAKIAQRKPVDRVSFHILDLIKENLIRPIWIPKYSFI